MGCVNSTAALSSSSNPVNAGTEMVYLEHSFARRWSDVPESTSDNPSIKVKPKTLLGKGGFSSVYLIRHNKTGVNAAVKVNEKKSMSEDDIKTVNEEVRIMRMLQHPNIVKFIDVFDEKEHIYVVIEYLEGGALFDRVVEKEFYSEKDARDLIFVFLSALKFCHDRDIVHRDIKPENLLMSSKSDDADVKIADFGLSIHLPNGQLCQHACGTPNYIAPEMIGKKGYSKPVDMWAVGCIAFILLGGYLPFDTDDTDDPHKKKLYSMIKKGAFEFEFDPFDTVSSEAKDLIRGLLTVDPAKRLTVEKALEHSWVKRAGSELAARNLASNLKRFKAFMAKRKFKGAVKGVIATNKFKSLVRSIKSASSDGDIERARSTSTSSDAPLQDTDDIALYEGAVEGQTKRGN
jgi:calcium/calmodulin-dependent protein kinase I